MRTSWVFFSCVMLMSASSWAATLEVGPGKTYETPCQAIAVASDGDLIEIDASGNYDGDVCAVNRNHLTLRGVGGRAKIDADGKHHGGKAIWVITGHDTVVENIEFTGAKVPDKNGAGIRQEGHNLTVRNCVFLNNENGILAGNNMQSEFLIEYSEFGYNGFGDGYSHNLYINHVARLTFRFNYSHHANRGHLLKSRAAENYILYNRLTGETGNQSYEIDIPNGGRTYVLGNLLHQGPNTENSSMISFRREGAHADNPLMDLFVVHNTFVSDRSTGIFINVDSGVGVPAVIRNNIFVGSGTVVTQGIADQSGNHQGDPGFVDRDAFDYRLVPGSAAENAGVDPGSGAGYGLTPTHHYIHPAESEGRVTVGVIDIGAYEVGGSAGGTAGAAGGGGEAGAGGGGTGGSSAGSGGTGGGEAGTSGGPSGTGGTAGVGGSAGQAGASGGSPGASGGTDPSTPSTTPSDEQGGCGCRTTSNQRPFPLLMLGLFGILAGIRRRGPWQPSKAHR